MPVFNLSEYASVGTTYINEMRDVQIQKDRLRFRKNLERLGEVLAYEVSKSLQYEQVQIQTPLGVATSFGLVQQPVLATILRAGLPMYYGFLEVFDRAESAFSGAYRGQHKEDYTFEITTDYLAAPRLEGRPLILIDPMLATGKSLLATYKLLQAHGQPAQVHIAVALASNQGISFIEKNLPDAFIWAGAIDAELNQKSYIVPGLGDAGDLCFGGKS
jgi:uracil phosphoribosyltransferase